MHIYGIYGIHVRWPITLLGFRKWGKPWDEEPRIADIKAEKSRSIRAIQRVEEAIAWHHSNQRFTTQRVCTYSSTKWQSRWLWMIGGRNTRNWNSYTEHKRLYEKDQRHQNPPVYHNIQWCSICFYGMHMPQKSVSHYFMNSILIQLYLYRDFNNRHCHKYVYRNLSYKLEGGHWSPPQAIELKRRT